ncbi:NlpC/P60 family protein [Rhodococcus artemisiae]|uniref:NlpC/P60 family protein n=1 Tax=Rhodococcus artemisiae TaxID=714159 RepID=A0ABU7LJD2_9NOCA|nr:NlpC/P60 family protein [Rhodococcus artemisiae]MEE2061678.1 NlpC/P60 family protein [Rhodococcus artemisiae]
MSVDPSSLIVVLGTAVNAVVLGADLPVEVDEHVGTFTESVEQGAAQLGAELDAALATLPEPVREPVEHIVADTADRAVAGIEERIPEIGFVEPDIHTGMGIGDADSGAPVVAAPAGRPNPWGFGAPAPHEAAPDPTGGLSLPRIPAVLPGVSPAPIGAVAVFAPWLKKAGEICDGITAPVLAALYSVENGFRHGPSAPVSPAGARGPGQFMPGTWDAYGKDADGDGKADVLGIADPVMASGALLCDNWSRIEGWKRDGRVMGDTLGLTLAAYNAGLGAVLRSGGMPSGLPDYENQTKPYVAKILSARPIFERVLSPFIALGLPAIGDGGQRVIDEASRYLGLPYVWGGGNIHGPSGGGFDCSGLTSFAVHAATGISLPRTSETQWHVGTEIPLSEALPGDLVFGNWQAAGPGHVGIYIGGGQMVHAPTTGDVVRVGDVFTDMRARRIL